MSTQSVTQRQTLKTHNLIGAISLFLITLCSFLIAIGQYVSSSLTNQPTSINWPVLLWVGTIAGLLGLGHAIMVVLQSHGQGAIADELNKELSIFQAATPQNLEQVAGRMIAQLRQDLPGLTSQAIWPMISAQMDRLAPVDKRATSLVSAVQTPMPNSPAALRQFAPSVPAPAILPPPAPVTPMPAGPQMGAVNLADFSNAAQSFYQQPQPTAQ